MQTTGSQRGSEWNKWDLHVHTPASIEQSFGDSQQKEIWEKYIQDLESLPTEIKALGINDYFSLEGYRRVLNAKQRGRLPNIDLILPVVEFRLKMLAGHKKMQRINFHVIFSDKLTSDEIEGHFLNKLSITYSLEEGKAHTVVGCDPASLSNLGQAIIDSTPIDKRSNDSALKVGFANAVFSDEQIRNLCNQTIFHKKIVTVLGITEWDNMRFGGGGTGIKRDLINNTDLVFVASPDVTSYQNRLNQLIIAEVNSRLIDCSDAHHFSNSKEPMRLGNTFSWLKADLTFEGLRRAIRCFEDRVIVIDKGQKPPKLKAFEKQQGKFIDRIEIRKKQDSTLEEKWFDCEIPINPGLAAIIGNQGSGKSALTDIVALCGNSKTSHFSFLSPDKFRNRENKASQFVATLHWSDGTTNRCNLDADVEETNVERVSYVPQLFFDLITNETSVDQKSQFYGEIKKVIFSHISKSDRMRCENLDQLVLLRTKEIKHTLITLRNTLGRLNRSLYQIEEQIAPSSLDRLNKQIKAKEAEIITHKTSKPEAVQEPADAAEINAQIKLLRQQENDFDKELTAKREALTTWKTRREVIVQKKQAAENEQRRIQELQKEWQQEFDNNGIELDAEKIISFQIKLSLFDEATRKISSEIEQIEQQLDENIEGTPAYNHKLISFQREKLQLDLEENNKAYQQYLSELQEWNNHQIALIGDETAIESLKWLEHKKKDIQDNLPKSLNSLYIERQVTVKEIHNQLWKLATVYKELAKDVREYIASNELTRERYHLKFDIKLSEQGFIDRFFQMVKHRGSFSGVDESKELVASLIKEKDFNSEDQTVEFVQEILARLKQDHRQNPPSLDDVNQMMRINQNVIELYNYLFGLEYLNPQYTISLNNKPLKMLSPGERGVLLLVFYLLIDQDDKPLIIDQPEGNLNNQAIVRDLVPVFKEAKKRRQIIMVTHNPNLAVVCDAEQIIHAYIDFQDNNAAHFQSGSMENPLFNDLMVDLLEGTPPAFRTRQETYYNLSN